MAFWDVAFKNDKAFFVFKDDMMTYLSRESEDFERRHNLTGRTGSKMSCLHFFPFA